MIVAALAVMATATIGALLGSDLLERLFIDDARAEWGAVDVEVTAEDNAVIDGAVARRLIQQAGPAASAAAPRLLLAATAGTETARVADVLLLGLGPDEVHFPAMTAVEGWADPTTLAFDEVLLNQRLADRLGAGVGDDVTLWPAVPQWSEDVARRRDPLVHGAVTPELPLRVVGVVANEGTADLHRTPNAMMNEIALQRAGFLGDRFTVVHLTAQTRDREGADALLTALGPDLRDLELRADPVAADQLDLAEEDAGLFRSILLTLAFIVIAAASVATHGLLVRLGEERSRDLGLLRALGVRRRVAAGLLIAESAALGLAGALVGGALGVPFGNAMASGLADHFARLNLDRGREQVALVPTVSPAVLLTGAAIIVVVAGLAGRSSARLLLAQDTAALLRGAPPVPPPAHGRKPAVWRVLGWLTVGAGAVSGGPLVYLGLTMVLAAWWAGARRADHYVRRGDRDRGVLDRRAAWAALAWAVVGAALLGDFGAGVQAGFGVLTTAGLVAVFAVVVLLAPRLRGLMRGIRTYLPAGPPQAALRTAGSWAEINRRRSVTTTATVGSVVFMVAALGVLGSAQALPVERQAGGFDVVASSISPIDVATLRGLPEVGAAHAVPSGRMPQRAYGVDGGNGTLLTVPYPVRLAGATAPFASGQAFGLAAGEEGMATSADALLAVAEGRDKVVVDRAALPEGAGVGDDVVIDLGAAPRPFRIVAVLDTYLLNTAFVHEAEMARLVDFRGPTLGFLRAADGVGPDELAAAVERRGRDAGLTAKTVARIRDDVVAVNRTFTDIFAIMLVLGLAVSVASVASYLARAARERRAQLSVLRALGLRRRGTVLALAAEPLLTSGVGVVVGLVVGVGVLRALFAVGFSDLAFVVDWGRVGLLGAGLVGALVVVCGVTARLATDDRVAEGLRDVG